MSCVLRELCQVIFKCSDHEVKLHIQIGVYIAACIGVGFGKGAVLSI